MEEVVPCYDKYPFPASTQWGVGKTSELLEHIRVDLENDESIDYWRGPNDPTRAQCLKRFIVMVMYYLLKCWGALDLHLEPDAEFWTAEFDGYVLETVLESDLGMIGAQIQTAASALTTPVYYTAKQVELHLKFLHRHFAFMKKQKRVLYVYNYEINQTERAEYVEWFQQVVQSHDNWSATLMVPGQLLFHYLLLWGYKSKRNGESPGLEYIEVDKEHDFDAFVVEVGEADHDQRVLDVRRYLGKRRPFTLFLYEETAGIPAAAGQDFQAMIPGVNLYSPRLKNTLIVNTMIERMSSQHVDYAL